MAATYTKPVDVMRYGDLAANKSEPSSAQKDVGAVLNGIANSSHLNWNSENIGDWLAWINERIYDGPISGGESEDVMFMVPGETTDSFLYWDNSAQVVIFEHDLVPGVGSDAALGDATRDWLNVYTKNLFVENFPLCQYIVATVISALTYNTEVDITPHSTNDDVIKSDGMSFNTSRELSLDSGMPAGVYEISYIINVSNSATASITFELRPYIDTGSGFTLITDATITAKIPDVGDHSIAAKWLIDLAVGDDFKIVFFQVTNDAASSLEIGSNFVAKLIKPTYA